MTGTFALVLADGDESSGSSGLLVLLLVLLLAWVLTAR
jgi:hypothetical protein